jgi:hypothetical protein
MVEEGVNYYSIRTFIYGKYDNADFLQAMDDAPFLVAFSPWESFGP